MGDDQWTFAGDEAGYTSFRFERGATRYFVVALIGTQYPELLRKTIATLRQQHNLPLSYEFGSHKTTARQLRSILFDTLNSMDFGAWVAIADKEKLPDNFKIMPSRSFYVYMVSKVVEAIPLDWRENSVLLLDEFDRSGKTMAELKRALRLLAVQRGFKHIHARRSYSDDLIQIADLVAGAVLRQYTKQDPLAFQSLKPKIKGLHHVTG